MTPRIDYVTIGKIERPFGVHGEVRVRSLSDVPGRFEQLRNVIVASSQGKELETRVTHVRSINGGYILGLEAFSTPEEAAGFRGTFLKIPRDETAAAQPGHYYEFQLLGLTVVSESGDRLGRIEDILETRGHHVFVIRNARGERLLPATKAVVRSVDLDAGTMTVQWTDLEEDAADAV